MAIEKLVGELRELNGLTVGVAGSTMLLIVLHYLLLPSMNSREPPQAPAGIPIIGHMLGFMRHSFGYYAKLHESLGLPIFTIRMPGRKIYVITQPELITRVDRQHKAFSFAPIISEFSSVTCGTSKVSNEILNQNLLGEHGNWGLCEDMVSGMREALKPGANLDKMNRVMAAEVCASLEATRPEPGTDFRVIQLSAWVADVVTMATTNSVYGPMNPYKRQDVKDAFWEFEQGIMKMLVSPFPEYAAKKSIAARNKVTGVLGEYFAGGHHEQGSGLAQARFDYSVRNNVPLGDIGRFEIGGTIAILVNTLPSCYWMLLLAHAVPGLLEELRSEVDAALVVDKETSKVTVDITTVKNECPLLLSTLKESLRYRAMGTAVRVVVQDVDVGGYMLTKGSLVQIPLGVLHTNETHWGSTADEFDAHRFIKDPSSGRKKKIPDDSGFRGFGGGKHLCPGRFFATNEILAVVALFISRFEMTPVGGGDWVMPTTENSNAATQIAQADFEMDMEVRNRPGFENYTWNVELRTSTKVTTLLANDGAD